MESNSSYQPPPYKMVNGWKVFDPCGGCGEEDYYNEHGVCKNCYNPCTKCGKQPCTGTLIMCGGCVVEEMKAGRG